MKQFKQRTIWNPEDKFMITGIELTAIETMAKEYTKFIQIMESMLVRNLNEGNIQVKYEDLEGNEIPKEEILQMFEEAMREAPNPEPNL